MRCDELRQLLRQCQGQVSALPPTGRNHLKECDDCAVFAEHVEFSHLLQQIPVPPASAGFTDRALQRAWEQRERDDQRDRSGTFGKVGLAACLVLATSVALQTLWLGREAGESGVITAQKTQMAPERVNNVNLLMVSAMDLPEAMITLRMDANVELAGYGGSRELVWPTSLSAGNNQITLPVQLQGSDSGNISVRIESGGASKELQLTIEAMPTQSAALFLI